MFKNASFVFINTKSCSKIWLCLRNRGTETSGEREETAPPRRSEPLRSKVGGASKPSPCCAGWDRLGIAVYSLQLIVNSLRLISWLFADNLQISCDFLGGFEKKA